MSDLLLNLRIGTRHLKVAKQWPLITFRVNPYNIYNPPKTFFEVL